VKKALLDEAQRARIGQRVLRARIRLALSRPFLATAVMRLPVCEVHGLPWCATAATDGYHLFYNPGWVTTLGDGELRGVLAHEVLHALFAHAGRRGVRDPRAWNIACDHAINLLLVEQGFRLPEGGLLDRRFSGMSAEQIHGLLQQGELPGAARGRPRPDPGSSEAPDTLPVFDDDLLDPTDPRIRSHRTADAPDAQQLDELRRELREQALARLSGASAKAFQQACSDAQRIDWRTLLRAWLTERIKGDWQSFPYSKRHLHRGLYMPSPGLAVPGHVVYAIDTSGSMDEAVLAQIASELRAFRQTFPCRLSVLQADDRIRAIQTFEAMDGLEIPKRLELKGRGVTDFRPVFDWVATQPDVALVLYATDGEGTFPAKGPGVAVMWLITGGAGRGVGVPFGGAVGVTA
jgi:predicted metal-dependent peptidase